MGRWGDLLFEGDTDLDLAGDIGEDAGLEVTRVHLNNGVFDRLFTEYTTTKAKSMWEDIIFKIMILTALVMRVGATISQDHISYLRKTVSRNNQETEFGGPMKDQFIIALKWYKNDGTPYDFHAIRCEVPTAIKVTTILEDGKNIFRCGKSRFVFYCGKEC